MERRIKEFFKSFLSTRYDCPEERQRGGHGRRYDEGCHNGGASGDGVGSRYGGASHGVQYAR